MPDLDRCVHLGARTAQQESRNEARRRANRGHVCPAARNVQRSTWPATPSPHVARVNDGVSLASTGVVGKLHYFGGI